MKCESHRIILNSRFVTRDPWSVSRARLIGAEARVGLNTECTEFTEFAEKEGIPHPPVFFVRVADKGLMLDAARKSGKCGT